MVSWHGKGITGSNKIPLGSRRQFEDGESNPTPLSHALPLCSTSSGNLKRMCSPVELEEMKERGRKKRNRWGDSADNKAAGLMGLPTMIMANMTSEQLEAYILHLRIQEISEKLRINDVVPADRDRSPSPPPQYDNCGKRINTREHRYRKRLEDERHKQIHKAIKIIPNYHPPSDYRGPTKTQEKVYLPVKDFPEINFIGQLLGPRGTSLKKMETQSQAKIAIRGKGSVKEGKGRSDSAHNSDLEEDLHCLIIADTEEKISKAKKLVQDVIETAASTSEGLNKHKLDQLRYLATLNGTFRDDENQDCQNCKSFTWVIGQNEAWRADSNGIGGRTGHRKYDCPEPRNFTSNIKCHECGNAGHLARDCPDRQRGGPDRRLIESIADGDAVDLEYRQLMQEIGGNEFVNGKATQLIEAPPGVNAIENGFGVDHRNLKPWQRGPTGETAPWAHRGQRHSYNSNDGRSPPPWTRKDAGDRKNSYGGSLAALPGGPVPWPSTVCYGYIHQEYPGDKQLAPIGNSSAQQSIGPSGLGRITWGLGAPPCLGSSFHDYIVHRPVELGQPPPPPDNFPPPPPSSTPPPPPTGA